MISEVLIADSEVLLRIVGFSILAVGITRLFKLDWGISSHAFLPWLSLGIILMGLLLLPMGLTSLNNALLYKAAKACSPDYPENKDCAQKVSTRITDTKAIYQKYGYRHGKGGPALEAWRLTFDNEVPPTDFSPGFSAEIYLDRKVEVSMWRGKVAMMTISGTEKNKVIPSRLIDENDTYVLIISGILIPLGVLFQSLGLRAKE